MLAMILLEMLQFYHHEQEILSHDDLLLLPRISLVDLGLLLPCRVQ